MPKVVHFEIPADQLVRAKRFYTEVFGWKFEGWPGGDDYWLAETGPKEKPGIDGALVQRPVDRPATNVTISVPSIEEYREKVVRSGGRLRSPKEAIPGVGLHFYCEDTEGNVVGVLQEDPAAK